MPSFSKFSPLVFIRLPFYFYFPTPWWTVSVRPNYGGVTTPVSYRERLADSHIWQTCHIQQTMFYFCYLTHLLNFSISLSRRLHQSTADRSSPSWWRHKSVEAVCPRGACAQITLIPPLYTQVHNWKEFYGGTSRLILFYIWFRTKNPSAKPSLCSRVGLLCSFSHSNSSRLYTRQQQSTLLLLLRRAACNWRGALIIRLALALMPVCILVWYVAVCTFIHVLYSLSLFFGGGNLEGKCEASDFYAPFSFLFFSRNDRFVCVCLLLIYM